MWSTSGLRTDNGSAAGIAALEAGFLRCESDHLTEFAGLSVPMQGLYSRTRLCCHTVAKGLRRLAWAVVGSRRAVFVIGWRRQQGLQRACRGLQVEPLLHFTPGADER